MEINVKQKAILILAGLATLPVASAATANTEGNKTVPFSYASSPYADMDLTQTTGLTIEQLNEGRALVKELNQLDVIAVRSIILTEAPRVPYAYNLPMLADVENARVKNLERLEKLRNIIEAAK